MLGIVLQIIGCIIATILSREWKLAPREDLRALFVTCISLMGSGPVLAPLHKGLYEGYFGTLYFGIDEYPRWWLLGSLVLSVATTETWFYWVHRAMHTPFLYKVCQSFLVNMCTFACGYIINSVRACHSQYVFLSICLSVFRFNCRYS